jgi:hypothetical protein
MNAAAPPLPAARRVSAVAAELHRRQPRLAYFGGGCLALAPSPAPSARRAGGRSGGSRPPRGRCSR